MINYEMALSEIEMYKKAHESLSENLTHANKKAQQFKTERDKFEQMINEECERGYQMEGKYRDMKEERDTLIDDLSWYKAKVSRLERENEEFKESHIKHITNMENYYKDRVQELKEKNGELQEVIEGKNSDLLFTEDENKQLKESRDWDYEYIIKVNEENKRLERELNDFDKDYEMVTNNCIYWEDKAHWLEDESSKYIDLLSEISQHIGGKPSSSTYKYFREKLDSIGVKEGADDER